MVMVGAERHRCPAAAAARAAINRSESGLTGWSKRQCARKRGLDAPERGATKAASKAIVTESRLQAANLLRLFNIM